ncbi:MAG TPA: hypothetical protein VG755_19260 [Nannocystaceae bacterium]|nr:hypothetical protein [Nannocystaceae bacterium]
MKIRIRGDSLRLRLSQSDVRALDREGRVDDALHFPAGTALGCELHVADVDALDATLDERTIRVAMPRAWARKLIDTDEVGVRSEVALEGGRTLVLLVEKDFRCLVPREGEEDGDGFDRSGC